MDVLRSRFAVIVFVAFFAIRYDAEAQDIDPQTKALELIWTAAERICGNVTTGGKSSVQELSGEAKAELSGVLSKVADLGGKVAAKTEGSDYEGVLQQDLAAVIAKQTDCKLAVFTTLSEKLLVAPAPTVPRADGVPTRPPGPPPTTSAEPQTQGNCDTPRRINGMMRQAGEELRRARDARTVSRDTINQASRRYADAQRIYADLGNLRAELGTTREREGVVARCKAAVARINADLNVVLNLLGTRTRTAAPTPRSRSR